MIYKYKARFTKAFRHRDAHDRQRITEAVEQIQGFFETRQAPEGLGLTKLFSREELGAVFEARATLALRILFAVRQETVTFLMLGNHDEVRRFIRAFQ